MANKNTKRMIESIIYKDTEGAKEGFDLAMKQKMLKRFRRLTEEVMLEDQLLREAGWDERVGNVVSKSYDSAREKIGGLINKGKEMFGGDPYNRPPLHLPKHAPDIGSDQTKVSGAVHGAYRDYVHEPLMKAKHYAIDKANKAGEHIQHGVDYAKENPYLVAGGVTLAAAVTYGGYKLAQWIKARASKVGMSQAQKEVMSAKKRKMRKEGYSLDMQRREIRAIQNLVEEILLERGLQGGYHDQQKSSLEKAGDYVSDKAKKAYDSLPDNPFKKSQLAKSREMSTRGKRLGRHDPSSLERATNFASNNKVALSSGAAAAVVAGGAAIAAYIRKRSKKVGVEKAKAEISAARKRKRR